jgi:hypothetical protein
LAHTRVLEGITAAPFATTPDEVVANIVHAVHNWRELLSTAAALRHEVRLPY